MKHVNSIEIDYNKEELIPWFSPEFPYIASCAELGKYREREVPWHWHRMVELFYMKSGTIEYTTPAGKWIIPAGSGGMVNSNVLHASIVRNSSDSDIQLLHIFDPVLLAGEHGSRMEKKYILPLTASSVEMIPLYQEDPEHAQILLEIREAFSLSDQDWGYEFRLREALTKIWLKLFEIARPEIERGGTGEGDDQIKMMMAYIHEHYRELVSVEQLAQAVHISKRACFRTFREKLRMTPGEYLQSCRLQKACQLLAKTKEPVTRIAYHCGFGSGSYFGMVFRKAYGCSPSEYRKFWHDHDKNRRE